MTVQTTRRGFLAGGLAAGAALVVGFTPKGALAAGHGGAEINPFVKVDADGTLTVVLKHFEMGQGTTTGLTTLVAEEMDADWDAVAIEFAPADDSKYANLFFGGQGTGGSTAIANSFMQYRQAGAAARAVLVAAAAKQWGVAESDITLEKGMLKSGDKTGHYGEFAAAAAEMTPPAEPVLKDASAFNLIGDARLPRKDSAAKTDGTATFAIDVRLPDMVYAVLLRSPKFGGKLTSFDASAAADIQGFVDARAIANGAGVAVYGTSTWAAISARDAITAEWDFSAAETRSTPDIEAEHIALLDTPTYEARPGATLADSTAALEGAAQVVEADFLLPHLAHAPMEPLNCTIEATENGVRVHDGCQFPTLTRPFVAGTLGLDPSQVEIVTVYAGGSFGRRANTVSDYHVEAALVFDALGRERPVKLVWTREDDLAGGFYRPMAAHRAKIGIDGDGNITGWDHRVAAQPIFKGTPFEAVIVHDGVDHGSVEGIADTPYNIPAFSVGLSDWTSPMPVLWWRSVGHSHTAFVKESLIDMAATAAGRDPIEFRLSLLGDDTNADHKRLRGVLELVAEKSGWGGDLPEGRGRGVAVHKSFNTYVAEVIEVSTNDGAVKIEKVTCAVDCGVAVNPDVIKAQMEGGVGYALGHVMRNQITMTDGVVDQANFPDYEPLRIYDIGSIDVHLVPSTEAPTGVGEPGVPPAGPALANAIAAATGTRVTKLPMWENGIEFA
ncbi:xanthine dehydrogenase family protein molybdopterin-binding subunit [Actibacterium lipolyticum]|uniref:Isoquinoline 1-oxidoreductase subunit beta n=1 Tax=Actibacterium lipolyticum TaxID=1524263 RepID=A0A238JVZ3_9RHOB|nr:molybdopterin cofactor-binding domain-containing protein [Actibacterium lipolyticum]SMX33992.1 Isoquinoline 1-oxidoreductase subunit beta [Actibacterium lipolyticum]